MSEKISRLTALATIAITCAYLTGCGNDDPNASDKANKKVEAPNVNENGMTEEGARLNKEFEERNKPLKVEFSAPGLVDSAEYLDIQAKLSAIQVYTAKRSWDETPEEIAHSIRGSILVESALPALYELEEKLNASSDAFEKRDLSEKIASLIKEEAVKINGNIRVKMIADAGLKSYDFDSHIFFSENCLFSEKLEYTKEDMRTASSYANAQKPRCYLQPSTTNFRVGVVNGTKLNLNIDEIDVAKKIEAARDGARFEIYGYVASVEREQIGGRLGDARYVMVDPQKVNIISKSSGEVLYSKSF
ncbi:hypothetical protein [Pseudomonas putida]|uniref:hypothetical protein n=1 Tax=Pseudomonas putida TaxID=303 RepID=UPI0012DB1D62|nr:hypothetical protein [Pseudomonas putida]